MVKNFYWAVVIFALLLANLGCDRFKKRVSKPVPSSSPKEVEYADNLDDMYVKIYGDGALVRRDGVVYVDVSKLYSNIKNMNTQEVEKHYAYLLEKGKRMVEEGKFEEAVKSFNECAYIEDVVFKKQGLGHLERNNLAKKMLEMAKSLDKQGKWYEALKYAEVAVMAEPQNVEMLKMAGLLYSKTGEEGLAIPFLATVLKKRPYDHRIKYVLKNLYLLEGEPRRAISLIDLNIDQYSRFGTHWGDLAEAYFMLSKMEPNNQQVKKKVEYALNKAISYWKVPRKEKIELQLSKALFKGDFNEALEILDRLEAVTIDPRIETRIIYNKALLNLALGRWEKAYKGFEDTISRVDQKRKIGQGESYMALMSAWAFDVIGVKPLTPREAVRIFKRVREPDHSYRLEFSFILGYLKNRKAGNFKEAVNNLIKLQKKRNLEPIGDFVQDIVQVPAQKGIVYISMANMYAKLGDIEKAKEYLLDIKENPFFGYKAKYYINRLKAEE